MLLLDITVVNTALPSIEEDLGASFTDLQWVVDAYALSLAALVLVAGSLADGVYDLTVVASKVHAVNDPAALLSADLTLAFHRLYGDNDGDGDVDAVDLFQLRSTVGRSAGDPPFKPQFDYDASTVIDAVDLFQIRSRLASREEHRRSEETGKRWIPIDAPVDLPYENPIAQIGSGELFGEMTCMSFHPRSATVRAKTTVVVLEMLREEGFSPVAESPSGTVTVPTRPVRRVIRRSTVDPALVHAMDQAQIGSLVAGLRASESHARAQASAAPAGRTGPPIPANDPTTSVAVIREAIADGRAVWLGYSDGIGRTQRMLFYPERLDGGRVSGVSDGVSRTLSIHRITGVVAD